MCGFFEFYYELIPCFMCRLYFIQKIFCDCYVFSRLYLRHQIYAKHQSQRNSQSRLWFSAFSFFPSSLYAVTRKLHSAVIHQLARNSFAVVNTAPLVLAATFSFPSINSVPWLKNRYSLYNEILCNENGIRSGRADHPWSSHPLSRIFSIYFSDIFMRGIEIQRENCTHDWRQKSWWTWYEWTPFSGHRQRPTIRSWQRRQPVPPSVQANSCHSAREMFSYAYTDWENQPVTPNWRKYSVFQFLFNILFSFFSLQVLEKGIFHCLYFLPANVFCYFSSWRPLHTPVPTGKTSQSLRTDERIAFSNFYSIFCLVFSLYGSSNRAYSIPFVFLPAKIILLFLVLTAMRTDDFSCCYWIVETFRTGWTGGSQFSKRVTFLSIIDWRWPRLSSNSVALVSTIRVKLSRSVNVLTTNGFEWNVIFVGQRNWSDAFQRWVIRQSNYFLQRKSYICSAFTVYSEARGVSTELHNLSITS